MILGKRLVILSSSCLKEIGEEDLVVVKYTHASTESVLHIAGKEGNLVVMGVGSDRRTNLGAVSRDLESLICESLVERVGRVGLRHVEVAEHNEVSRKRTYGFRSKPANACVMPASETVALSFGGNATSPTSSRRVSLELS